jgi:hypothetical protein
MVQPKITLYVMEGCGYCSKAQTLLQDQIRNGEIQVKPLSEANGKYSGAPAFVSLVTNNDTMGLPESYESLLLKLGHKEDFGPDTRHRGLQHGVYYQSEHKYGQFRGIDPRRLADPMGTLKWYQAGVL